jgi:hypothetical protein
MDDESKFWFIIGLFLTAVGLIGLMFCFEFLAIEYSTGMLLMTIVMLFIFLGGFLTSIFELLLEFLGWPDRRMGG